MTALIERSDIVCFTGSVATGMRVAAQAAGLFIPAFLELGGKDPAIVLASADLGQSVFKLATTVYLVGLALITASLVTSERMLRHAMIAWLAATAAMALLAVATLVAFYLAPGSGLLGYSLFHFGTLPPGNYPRFALTFFNANMLANYL
ncbi:aldehyde dehydrogenase family protein, partial [uncultured Arthrobacter sp.]|uniref:aldehyde dehydrogenase family protein n=1 Tax=uncultured Arthrobacter sp. TaxID=114050 RepID=UPI003216691B